MRRSLLLPLLGLATACGPGASIPDTDLAIRVTAGAADVALGRAFPLTVVRTWSKDLVPAAWDDRSLAPLVLRLEETTRREDARHVEETRRFRGYAFSRTDVSVPGVRLRARPKGGGPDRVVTADPLRLRVEPALDPAAPGPPELPSEPLPEPRPIGIAVAVALAALGALVALVALGLRSRRRPRAEGTPVPPAATGPAPVGAHVRALERLRAIRERGSASVDEVRADVVEGADVVRAYLGERLALGTAEMTTEEILRAPPTERALDRALRESLADLFGRSDQVKFAAAKPSAPEGGAFLSLAEAFVRGLAADAGPGREPAPSGPEEGPA